MERFNAADYLVGRHVRDGHGDAPAVITPSVTLSYAELGAQVRQVAAGLAGLGVRPEERVLACMPDDAELFTAILAVMYLGAVIVPCSTMLTALELGKLVADSRTRVVLGGAQFADKVHAAVNLAPEVRHVVLTSPAPAAPPLAADHARAAPPLAASGPTRAGLPPDVTVHVWAELCQVGELAEPYDTWPDSPALWLYTSGTTGQPKAAMHRH
jgi:benzoate-CoA ligase